MCMNILCPGISAWSWMPQRPQQMLRAAARAGHQCFYVEPAAGLERVIGADPAPAAGPREVAPGVHLYGDLELARRAAGTYLLYYTNPLVPADLLRNGPVMFDAVDDFPEVEPAMVHACQTADRVICSSEGVRSRLAASGIAAAVIPNACDYGHWSAAPASLPMDADVLPRPLAVFIGAVAQWVDVGLVAACAEAMPEAAFLLVGPHLKIFRFTPKPPANLWIFGIRPYDVLPAYAYAADLLMLPFREDLREAQAANPVKLWEYLATGRPIVSTNIPDVAPLQPLVRVASGDGFIAEVAQILGRDDGLAAPRRAVAATNTWDERWRRVEASLA